MAKKSAIPFELTSTPFRLIDVFGSFNIIAFGISDSFSIKSESWDSPLPFKYFIELVVMKFLKFSIKSNSFWVPPSIASLINLIPGSLNSFLISGFESLPKIRWKISRLSISLVFWI